MDSASVHRKIELQSPEDFTYLINNVRRAAADSINAAFPPVEGADGREDELRMRIEQLVNDYIAQTFALAAPNLTINGLPAVPELFLSTDAPSPVAPEEQYEPFDGRKRLRVEELAREEEDLLREIAALKRRVPGAAAAGYADAFKAAVRADEESLEELRRQVVARGARASEGGGSLGVVPLQRQDAMEGSFRGAVETLGRLKRDMPATVAKMERARVAGEYVATER